jgi:hypothetical protein
MVGCYLILLMAKAIKELIFLFENLVSRTYENILRDLLILVLKYAILQVILGYDLGIDYD